LDSSGAKAPAGEPKLRSPPLCLVRSADHKNASNLERPIGSDPGKGNGKMDSNYVDKSRLPSRHVTEGPERAPHRSYLYAMGLTDVQIHQPLVGVATAWNEAALNLEACAVWR
jgi:hypothetical protein